MVLVPCLFASHLLIVSELAQRVHEAHLHGEELHLEAEWPLQAMTWISTNMESQGRLYTAPLRVPVLLTLAREHRVAQGGTFPPVVMHDAVYRPNGSYRQDSGTFGMIIWASLFINLFHSFFLLFQILPLGCLGCQASQSLLVLTS